MIAILAGLLLSQGTVLDVGPGGDWQTITAAVAAAPAGATLRIAAGVWREPIIVINRPMTLQGMPGAILDGGGERELMRVHGPDVIIRDLTFRNTGHSAREERAALHLDGASACLVSGNRFEDTHFAIYLSNVHGCSILSNGISGRPASESMSGNAIHARGSRDLTIIGNSLRGHRDGIYLESTRRSVVADNVSEGHVRYGLHFMYADSSHYGGNTFRGNGSGVAVMYTRQVTMSGNRFVANRGATAHGLLLKDVSDATLDANLFEGNTTGMLADGAERLRVTDSDFRDNGRAVRMLSSSSGVVLEGNRFEGNTFDVTVNGRNTRAQMDGNWWDSYAGWDLDRDGRGDVPHHPVRLFAVIAERTPVALMVQRSLFVRVLDAAEQSWPVLTPRTMVDARPLMRPGRGAIR